MKGPTRTLAVLSLAAAAAAAGSVFAQAVWQLPGPRAEAIWNYLIEEDYQSWELWPGTEPFAESSMPHGALITTYVNPIAAQALLEGSGEMPRGTMIVKENYNADRELESLTAMYKAGPGYYPEANNWFWLKRLPSGENQLSGQVASCADCHQEGERDFLMSPLPERTTEEARD